MSSSLRDLFWNVMGLLLVGTYIYHVSLIFGEMPKRLELGIYQPETENGRQFRWIEGLALVRRKWETGEKEFQFKAFNYDLPDNPLTVWVEQNRKILGQLKIEQYKWYRLTVKFNPEEVLVFRTSRTFRAAGDHRILGVAVSGL